MERCTVNGQLILDVEIPANTTAAVYIPAINASSVTENGKSVTSIQEIKIIETSNGYLQLLVGSGKYQFAVKQ